MIRSNTFRKLLICVVASSVWCGASLPANAQNVSVDETAIKKADANAYRMVFRQVDAYKEMADKAKAAHENKEYLRKVIPGLIEVRDADAPNFERLSVGCAKELRALQAKVVRAIDRLHAQRLAPGYKKESGPPPELVALQAEEDSVVLRYRDTLRNTMDEAEFQNIQLQVRTRFGKAFAPASDTTPTGAR